MSLTGTRVQCKSEMRRHLKKKIAIFALLLVAGGLYLTSHRGLITGDTTKFREPNQNDSNWQAERLVQQESWVERGGLLPLNLSYQLLAGSQSAEKYLCIGISSVKRKKGSYLISTLQSIFSQSSPQERSSMVVVVLLADFDASWRTAAVRDIRSAFSVELRQGQLVVLHVPEEWYPPITGLKRNFNDPADRVTFRSKQNLDYSFLMYYSAGLARYYLQLEDDISSAKNFLTTIKRHVEEQDGKKKTWAMLEFSALGYIGKLYKSADLPILARFLFLFYQEMPCDWLMSHFRVLLTQKEPIHFKPSLFQHMGTFSSFQGNYNKLKDKDFEEEMYSNPPAKVYSDIPTYQKNIPKLAWGDGEGFFWGRSPEKGNYLTVVFTEPAVVTSLFVETGSGGKDLLESASVEIGCNVVLLENEETSCQDFQLLGNLENGMFQVQGVDLKFGSASSCLRIQVTEGQKDWVIIKRIRVKTKPGEAPHSPVARG